MTRKTDFLIMLALFLLALAAYLPSLAPGVLDNDFGLFQYVGYVLGVTYPTGYPLYTLLGWAWTHVLPLGTVAWRMNLFSAGCAALTTALTYPLAALVLELVTPSVSAGWRRAFAAAGALAFGLSATLWSLAVIASVNPLNALFVTVTLYLLARWFRDRDGDRDERVLLAFAFTYGLSLTHHQTMLLFGPAFVLFILLVDGRAFFRPRRILPRLLISLLPLLLYLYVPLRAGPPTLAGQGTEELRLLDQTPAALHGVVSPFYRHTPEGVLRQITGLGFAQDVRAESLESRLAMYASFSLEQFGWEGVVLGLLGALVLLRRRWRLFVLFAAGYASLVAFNLVYWNIAIVWYFVPCYLVVAVCLAVALSWIVEKGQRAIQVLAGPHAAPPAPEDRLRRAWRVWGILVLAVFLVFVPLTQWANNHERLSKHEFTAPGDTWREVLAYPLEEGAALAAHWGDLTPFWYLQNVDGLRTDLLGLSPPRKRHVLAWRDAGHAVYLAGPHLGWLDGIEDEAALVPWGNLVKVLPLGETPDLAPSQAHEANLGDTLAFLGADVRCQTPDTGCALLGAGFRYPGGSDVVYTLYFRAEADVPADGWLVALRLLDDQGRVVAQDERRLVSAWYPVPTMPAGTLALVMGQLTIPWGTTPGAYRPQVVVYAAEGGALLPVLTGGDALGGLALEPITVMSSTGDAPADSIARPVGANLGGRFVLAGYDGGEGTFQQGATVPLTTLWHAVAPDGRAYRIFWQLEAPGGLIAAEGEAEPLDGDYPTAAWQPGQWVRNPGALRVPGDAPPGDYRVLVGLRDADKVRLPVVGTLLPAGDAVALGTLHVTERPRTFDIPAMSHQTGARLGGVRLLGYDLPTDKVSPGGAAPLTLYWQCLAPLDANYTIFVHLVEDATGEIRGQVDVEPGGAPGGGAVPTSGWAVGEVVTDAFQVPLKPGAPAGAYTIYVGLYDATTDVRLPAVDATGQSLGDRVPVARFIVAH
ncbi:MAG: DUF2723 domain-containing protein [Chloroflexi bacterium]|nr:DUF2723 domain-containing protein [Chloroflexota bacterium]MBU1747238.1 DUF2723 domain-containing protein [Chloroflexota bacterium]MBU1879010.1 DUF2723 domain-containing protein [Chloroflexota bacterium]